MLTLILDVTCDVIGYSGGRAIKLSMSKERSFENGVIMSHDLYQHI